MKHIFSTKDYEKFTFYRSGINRDISRRMVKKLKDSLMLNNNLDCHPIVVDEDYVVIDGQHRLTAAKELDIPIHYIISASGKEIIPVVNSIQQSWGPVNYVNHYAAMGNPDYVWLKDLSFISNLKFTIISQILAHGRASRKLLLISIKEGTFKKDDHYNKKVSKFMDYYLEIIDLAQAWKRTFPLGHTYNRGFVYGLKCMFYTKGFDRDLFLRHYSYMYKQILANTVDSIVLESMLLVYNHKRPSKNRLTSKECYEAQVDF